MQMVLLSTINFSLFTNLKLVGYKEYVFRDRCVVFARRGGSFFLDLSSLTSALQIGRGEGRVRPHERGLTASLR